jgi:hypothetical protein
VSVIIDYASLTSDERAALEAVVRPQTTLQHVLREFGVRACMDIVTQDEYTHDILVAHRGLWLSYDTT